MGFRPTEEELVDLVKEIDEDGSGQIEFAEFCQLCATFLVEDPDIETMKKELKDAFRIYDKEGQGFITTETLRGLIGELLAPLTDEELEGIIEELDEDGSGSMDFDEFCEMMMTKPDGGDWFKAQWLWTSNKMLNIFDSLKTSISMFSPVARGAADGAM